MCKKEIQQKNVFINRLSTPAPLGAPITDFLPATQQKATAPFQNTLPHSAYLQIDHRCPDTHAPPAAAHANAPQLLKRSYFPLPFFLLFFFLAPFFPAPSSLPLLFPRAIAFIFSLQPSTP